MREETKKAAESLCRFPINKGRKTEPSADLGSTSAPGSSRSVLVRRARGRDATTCRAIHAATVLRSDLRALAGSTCAVALAGVLRDGEIHDSPLCIRDAQRASTLAFESGSNLRVRETHTAGRQESRLLAQPPRESRRTRVSCRLRTSPPKLPERRPFPKCEVSSLSSSCRQRPHPTDRRRGQRHRRRGLRRSRQRPASAEAALAPKRGRRRNRNPRRGGRRRRR